VSDGPRILASGDAWRIVRRTFVNKETGETLPEDVLETPNGTDAMDVVRWTTLTRKDAAMGDWIRVADALKVALLKQIEERETTNAENL